MANDNKLDIKINGDTVGIERSIKSVNAALSGVTRQANTLDKQLKFDPSNIDLLTRKQKELEQGLKLTAEKTAMLKEELNGLDPDIDTKAFMKVQNQLGMAESQAAQLNNRLVQTTQAISAVQSKKLTFDFDAGNGLQKFQNSLKGIEAAMSSVGDLSSVLNMEGADLTAKSMAQVSKFLELSKKQATLLKTELASVDVTVDPERFTYLNEQLRKVNAQINTLESKQIDIKMPITAKLQNLGKTIQSASAKLGAINFGSSLAQKIGNSFAKSGDLIGRSLQKIGAGDSVLSKITQPFTKLGSKLSPMFKAGFSASIEAGKASLKVGVAGFSAIFKAGFSGVKAIASSAFSGLRSLVLKPFQGIGSLIAKPFQGLKNSISTIFQGSLLTIGNKLTTGVGQGLRDTIASMQEASRASKSLENVLSFAGVDTSIVNKLKKDMGDYAKQTTHGSSELNKVVAGLVSSNVEAEKAGKLTKSIGNAYSLLGDGTRPLSDIGRIFSQINSATKLTAEDFNQLRDAGIGGALKQEIEKNFPSIISQFGTFQKAMSEGAISAEMVNSAIESIGNSDAAKKAATTPKTIKEAYQSLTETVGQKFIGMFEKINSKGIEFIQNITNQVDSGAFDGMISKALDSVSKLVGALLNVRKAALNIFSKVDFSGIATNLFGLLGRIGEAFKEVGDSSGISKLMGMISEGAKGILSLLSQLDFSGLLSGAVGVLVNVGETIKGIFSGIDTGKVMEGFNRLLHDSLSIVGSLIDSFATLWKSAGLNDVVAGAWNGLLSIVSKISDYLKSPEWTSTLTNIGTMFNSIDWAGIWSKMEQTFSSIVSGLKGLWDTGGIQSALQTALDIAMSLVDWVGRLFRMEGVQNLLGGLLSAISNEFNILISWVDKLFESFELLFSGVKFEGFTNTVKILQGVMDDLVGGALNGFNKVMRDMANNGFLDIVWSSLDKLATSIGNMVKPLKPVVKWIGELVGFIAGMALTGAMATITTLAEGLSLLADGLGKVFEAVVKFGESAWEWLTGIFGGSNNSNGGGKWKTMDDLYTAQYSNSSASYSTTNNSSQSITNNYNLSVVGNADRSSLRELARLISREQELGLA